jgi:glycosyltransferase involved in cell wall biosynthesis
MKGLVVVVNYNQEQEIAAFLDRLLAVRDKEDVVVIDDGSTDRSPEIAEARGVAVERASENRGIGDAIRRGIYRARDSGRDYVVIMSSNGKMRPEELPVVEAPILAGTADYVQGNRYLKEGSSIDLTPFRRATIPVFSVFASTMLGRRFTDITCGFRAYTVKFAMDPRMDLSQSWLDRYEMEYYLHFFACRLDYRIVEVPVTIVYSHLDRKRLSKIKPLTGWWSMSRPFVLLATGIRK